MNERIRELVEQAGLEMCSCGCEMPTRQSAKFAELIVRECADFIEQDQGTGEVLSSRLKEHFGVEE